MSDVVGFGYRKTYLKTWVLVVGEMVRYFHMTQASFYVILQVYCFVGISITIFQKSNTLGSWRQTSLVTSFRDWKIARQQNKQF